MMGMSQSPGSVSFELIVLCVFDFLEFETG